MAPRLKLFLPLILFAALALLLFRGLSLDPQELPSALVDKPFPAFSLPSLAGGEDLDRDLFSGEVSLVNVWATWCISCRVEHPYLQKLADAGVRIIGVNYKDDPEAARRWLAELGDPYRANIVDGAGNLGVDLGVYGAPETYLVDAEGVIRYRHVGVVDERVWTRTLAPLYREVGGTAAASEWGAAPGGGP
ncbi:DsbE family thiol:disulfide interchange protein [Parahaliea mediterranea]|uniref:DsbE family thiol:disulfide interchange protein n=1 Tax=Parahaliea mediterranea TaxID=651086 RepID=A0A939IKP2_9GAMM|nr:DsbE family thiol:disulfide interchange protein [Parahaliea mediterranea]MBN7798974.1 DsbE family thiol:disulfide interchange protein [Parahaliea mediterranea]